MRILLAFLLALSAYAAGAVQTSISQLGNSNNWVLAYYWTGDASNGTIPVTAANLAGCCQGFYITTVVIQPGSPSPTAGYALTLTDTNGADYLGGAATGLSSSATQSFAAAASAPPINGSVSLSISGQSVASAKGTVLVYITKPGTVNLSRLGGTGGSNSANWLTLANSPFLDVRVYNFTAQSIGGSITGGVSKTITMRPCPAGVAGTDSNHYLYLSGGTGTAEAVLITGGTCTSGASSGTISFTPVNNHSGSWSLQSDSGGIIEAMNVLPATGGTVQIPAGVTILVGSTSGAVITKANVTLLGYGGSSVIQARDNTQANAIVWVRADGFTLANLKIDGNRANAGTSAVSGSCITLGAGGTGGANHALIEKVEITASRFIGLSMSDNLSDIDISSSWIHDNGGNLDATGAGTGIHATYSSGTRTQNVRIYSNTIDENHNTVTSAGPSAGIALDATNVVIADNSLRNNCNVSGGQIANLGVSGIARFWRVTGNRIELGSCSVTAITSGLEVAFVGLTATGNVITSHTGGGSGIVLEGITAAGAGDAVIADNYLLNNSVGIAIIDAAGSVRGAQVSGNRVACSGANLGVQIATAATFINVTGNHFTDCSAGNEIVDNSTALASCSGNFPPSTRAYSRVLLEVHEGAVNLMSGGVVASAATINPTISSIPRQLLVVTGAAAIANITVPTGAMAGYILHVVPAAASTWTTTTAGNIGLASTAVVGKLLTFAWDGTKWWPSY